MNRSKERRFRNDRTAFMPQPSPRICNFDLTISSDAPNAVMSTTSSSASAMPNSCSMERTRFRWARLSQLAVFSRVFPETGPGSVQKISWKIRSSRRPVSSMRRPHSHPRVVEDSLGRRLDDGPRQPPMAVSGPLAFEIAQELGGRRILSGVHKAPGTTPHIRPAAQPTKRHGLHAATECATAHHDLLELGASIRPSDPDQHDNGPEVSEPVSQPRRQAKRPWRLLLEQPVAGGPPLAGEIELVGLVDELERPRIAERVMPHGELEIESSQVPQRSRFDLGRRAGCRTGPRVSGTLGPSAVLLTDAPGGEQALQLLEQAQRSEEHTSELQSPCNLVCRLLLEKKKRTSCGVVTPPQRP